MISRKFVWSLKVIVPEHNQGKNLLFWNLHSKIHTF